MPGGLEGPPGTPLRKEPRDTRPPATATPFPLGAPRGPLPAATPLDNVRRASYNPDMTPRKPMSADDTLQVRLTRIQRAAVDHAAATQGHAPSTWARNTIVRAAEQINNQPRQGRP